LVRQQRIDPINVLQLEQSFDGALFFPGPDHRLIGAFTEYHLQRPDNN